MRRLVLALVVLVAALGGLYMSGGLNGLAPAAPRAAPADGLGQDAVKNAGPRLGLPAEAVPAVTVAAVERSALVETLLVTGTLVARTEVLVAPEVEGLRVVALDAEEGDAVVAGQLLARLERQTLDVQLAQNDALLARARAGIGQAKSTIVASTARQLEASRALERAQPLGRSGTISDSTLDQRRAAADAAAAALVTARSGLDLAQAELAQAEAQRRDIEWRLSRTQIKAPVAGVISRRAARIGAVATGAGGAEPMFRLIAGGEVELEAEVPEAELARLQAGQKAHVTSAGGRGSAGRIRLVGVEVDRTTRLGKVRIAVEGDGSLRIGGFAQGRITLASVEALALPVAAVLFGPDGAFVHLVAGDRIERRKIETGISSGDRIEVRSGLTAGDLVAARAGTFLREGDRIRPVRGGAAGQSEGK